MEAKNLDFMHGTDWLQELCGDFDLGGLAGDIEAAMTCGVDKAAACFWGNNDQVEYIQNEGGIFTLALWLDCHKDDDGFYYFGCGGRRFKCVRCSVLWEFNYRIGDNVLSFVAHFVEV